MQSQPTTLLCRYGYDPLDRLTSHMLSGTPERQRFYCKSRLATEIQGAMKHSFVQHDDLLLAQQRVEDEVSDTTLLATEQQRSVVQTLKADHPLRPIIYSPYGHRSPENGLFSLLGFNGERPDPVTGHYLLGNGYRAFNPVLMRFNSADTLSPFGKGGLNAYAYCLGDPINLHDPSGNFALPTAFKKFMSIMGARGKTYMSGSGKTFSRMSGPEQVFSHSISMESDIVISTSRIDTRPFDAKSSHIKSVNFVTSYSNGNKIGDDTEILYNSGILKTTDNRLIKSDKSMLSLQELAFSQIPGKQLQFHYKNHALPAINPAVERINYSKALAKHSSSGQNRRSIWFLRNFKKTAKRGQLPGVRPNTAIKIIREQV